MGGLTPGRAKQIRKRLTRRVRRPYLQASGAIAALEPLPRRRVAALSCCRIAALPISMLLMIDTQPTRRMNIQPMDENCRLKVSQEDSSHGGLSS